MTADILMKGLPRLGHEKHNLGMGVANHNLPRKKALGKEALYSNEEILGIDPGLQSGSVVERWPPGMMAARRMRACEGTNDIRITG
jgi:hypothetical protein